MFEISSLIFSSRDTVRTCESTPESNDAEIFELISMEEDINALSALILFVDGEYSLLFLDCRNYLLALARFKLRHSMICSGADARRY